MSVTVEGEAVLIDGYWRVRVDYSRNGDVVEVGDSVRVLRRGDEPWMGTVTGIWRRVEAAHGYDGMVYLLTSPPASAWP